LTLNLPPVISPASTLTDGGLYEDETMKH